MNPKKKMLMFILLTTVVCQCFGGNPIFRDVFTADPAALVVGDTVYVYVVTNTSAQLFPLQDVRLLESPFSEAVQANRQYLLAHNVDRLLAPFWREAGLEPKAPAYGNWESMGLEGHSAGHYLSALSQMMASGADPDGEFKRRLDYMIEELAVIQEATQGFGIKFGRVEVGRAQEGGRVTVVAFDR